MIDHWPVEYADQLAVGNPSSNVAICCLWTRRDRLKAALDSTQYCVIGNLYSRAGISPMLRNVLANPSIRYLALTGKSLTDSDQALVDFFESGVDDTWQVRSNGAQIERDLPLPVLDEVRDSVRLIDLRGAPDPAAELSALLSTLQPLAPFAEPRAFPKTTPTSQAYPGEFLGHVIREQTIVDAWREALWAVMTFGHTSPTDYGLEQKEVLGLTSIIEKPAPCWDRLPEWSPFNPQDVKAYVERFYDAQKSDEIPYNYGYRLQAHWQRDQIEGIVAELRRSGQSRRAVASVWDPLVDYQAAEPPCLTTIQAVVRDGLLHLVAYLRSNDMFRAYALNASALADLQGRLAAQLENVGIGPLAMLSFSAHVYSDCWEACRPALAESAKLRNRFAQDARGSFVFRLEGRMLVADHFSPGGDLIQTFRAGDQRELARLIAPFNSRVDHALYLGREIDRLARCASTGERYDQDQV